MIILDTNVVSELMRPNPNSNVMDWVAGQAALCPSVPTLQFEAVC